MATEPAAPVGGDAGASAPAPLPIKTLTIENLRGIRHVRLTGLGRVNLLTGRNNIGKSSVIEALRLLASNDVPSTMREILPEREEDERFHGTRPGAVDAALRLISPFFRGFPTLADTWLPILIDASGNGPSRQLNLALNWFRLVHGEPDERPEVVEVPPEDIGDSGLGATPGLVAQTPSDKRRFLLPDHWEPLFPVRRDMHHNGLRCRCVGPYNGRDTSTLADLWDQIALTGLESHVVEALQIIEPGISAVSMIGGHRASAGRIAKVRVQDAAQPRPLRSFGDGVNRLFGIALSLVNAQGGLLLIDEFENGLHYSVQADAWRMIFKLAADLDIQVFATTHSWDAVEAFQQAATESPEQGALIRLARRGEDLIATTFSEDELVIVTRERIEVR